VCVEIRGIPPLPEKTPARTPNFLLRGTSHSRLCGFL